MNKRWFFLHIFVLIFTSIMSFLYYLALIIAPFIMIPGMSKEIMYAAIITGIFIGWMLMYFSIKGLWRNGTKITITPPKEKDVPPLDHSEFNKLVEQIKDTHMGPKLMNHVNECERCKEMALALNIQAAKHIDETDKLV